MSRLFDHGRRYDLVGITREFARTLRAELDYLREAENAERFAVAFAGDPTIHIPNVVRQLTTRRVLTWRACGAFRSRIPRR